MESLAASPTRPSPGVAVLVWNYDEQGGMERQAARLAEGLALEGARVTVATTFVPRAGVKKPPARESVRGVSVVRAPLRWWTFEGQERLWAAWVAWTLRGRVRELDAVYAVHAKTGAHAVEIGRALGLPVLVKLACAGEHGDFASLAREPEAVRLRSLLGRADRVLCLSNELEREARDAGLAPARLARVKNGVDLARFRPEGAKANLEVGGSRLGAGPLGAGPLVLAVGRLDRQKRLDVLLRGFALLLQKTPEARLAIAGEGPQRSELEALARELGLEGKVAFLGARSDVPELLRTARVFVLASAEEGQSNALLEALASGTPVVASAIAANREVVADGQEGLLVPVGDEGALAAAIERVLEDPDLAKRLGAAGRARALEHDPVRVAKRHLELLAEVSAGRRPPSTLALLGLWVSALLVSGRAIVRQAWRRLLGRSL